MTYEEKIEWLRRYRRAKQLERVKWEEAEIAHTEARHITQNISPVPGGSGDGQALPRSVERIAEAERAAKEQSVQCDAIRKEIFATLEKLSDADEYEILCRRYIRLQKWEQIAAEMHLDLRRVYRKHRKAIDELTI